MRNRLAVGALALTALFVGVGAPVAADPLGQTTEFPLEPGDTRPSGIVPGPDGAMWFTEFGALQIARITLDGTVSEFGPTTGQPPDITNGPDGNLWFTDDNGDSIGRITTSGVITEFPLPNVCAGGCRPIEILTGPDGRLWFTEFGGDAIGVIDPAAPDPGASIQEFPIPGCNGDAAPSCSPNGFTVGPDGRMWFAMIASNDIWAIDTSGNFPGAPFNVPTPASGLFKITSGPDGNLWFTEFNANQIGRVTLDGTFTEFPVPTADAGVDGISVGPDGALWYGTNFANLISRITVEGVITEYPLANDFGTHQTVTGPDCNVWFTASDDEDSGEVGFVGTGMEPVDGICTAPAVPEPVVLVPTFTG